MTILKMAIIKGNLIKAKTEEVLVTKSSYVLEKCFEQVGFF